MKTCEYCRTGPHVGQCPNCGAWRKPNFREPVSASTIGRAVGEYDMSFSSQYTNAEFRAVRRQMNQAIMDHIKEDEDDESPKQN